MVIGPYIRMGPLPRSLAAEANDCFMVRLLRGATEYKVAARSSRAQAAPLGSLAISQATTAQAPRPTTISREVNAPSASADGFSGKLCGNPLAWRLKASS